MAVEMVELRCPLDAQRMFGKIVQLEKPEIVAGNLLEFSCDKCRRRTGKKTFHLFNVAGEHVETRTD